MGWCKNYHNHTFNLWARTIKEQDRLGIAYRKASIQEGSPALADGSWQWKCFSLHLMYGGGSGLGHLRCATETERTGRACMSRCIKEPLRAGGKINSCRRGKKTQVWFECICCPLFLKASQPLAVQSAPITGAFPADYMQRSRVHTQHGLRAGSRGWIRTKLFWKKHKNGQWRRERRAASPGPGSGADTAGQRSAGTGKRGNVKMASATGPHVFSSQPPPCHTGTQPKWRQNSEEMRRFGKEGEGKMLTGVM